MEQKKLFSEVLASVTKYFLILVILVGVVIFCSGIRIVETGNVALVLRFGKLVGDTPEEQIHGPGLLLAFPYIIDEVIMIPTDRVMEQSVNTYYTPDEGRTNDGTYVITGDQNIATLSASVKYKVSDPVQYGLNVKNMEQVINGTVSSAMLSQAAATDVDDLLTGGKEAYATAVLQNAKQRLLPMGVELIGMELTQVRMPIEVREVYDQVNSAAVEAETIVERARSYVTTLIPNAQGTAAGNVATANANYSNKTAAAKSALAEFWGVLEEYEANPEVVKMRLYNEKVAKIIAAIGQVRIVEDEQSTIYIKP